MTDEQLAAKLEFDGLTPEQARGQIAQLKAAESFWQKYNDGIHPGHRLAVASWHELHKKAFPEPPQTK